MVFTPDPEIPTENPVEVPPVITPPDIPSTHPLEEPELPPEVAPPTPIEVPPAPAAKLFTDCAPEIVEQSEVH